MSAQNIPDWAHGLAVVVGSESRVTPRIEHTESDAARIASARLRAIAHSKEHNAPGTQYGFEFPASYYKDFAGPETSRWDAAVLVCIAEILEAPILKRSKFVWSRDNYDPRTGTFEFSDAPVVSIHELRAAVDARISSLSLSKAKIWEWYANVREPIGAEWWRSDLQTRIQKFKK